MKVEAKTPFYDRRGLHKKGDVVNIETAAFNPYTMTEIPEVVKKSAPVVEQTEEKTEEVAVEKPKRTRKKKV